MDETLYDRDISWLDFNMRVLELAESEKTPLMERLRFCDIFISNLDEFVMKRIGRIQSKNILGENEKEVMLKEKINHQNQRLGSLTKVLKKFLEKENIHLKEWDELNDYQRVKAFEIFENEIYPVLTPLAFHYGHSFPFISNLSKSIGACIRNEETNERLFTRIKIPKKIPQWYKLDQNTYINIDEIVFNQVENIFSGNIVEEKFLFRVTRNAELDVLLDDDHSDISEALADGLREKKFSPIVRLEISDHSSSWCLNKILEELKLSPRYVYPIQSIANYTKFEGLIQRFDQKKFFFPKWIPLTPLSFNYKNADIFEKIRTEDLLVHHPYESFEDSVEHFIEKSAQDPKVLAIKITVYRTDIDSRLIQSLVTAAQAGKEVAVLVELKARFEEQRNLKISEMLEREGIHVIKGMSGLKTHAKTCIVVRRDIDKLRTYVHIGTGNYNPKTARLYTDLSLFTCDSVIANDAIQFFNYLTGVTLNKYLSKLLIAPQNLKKEILKKIAQEANNAKCGRPARIFAKMNSLEDKEIINALYEASSAGVEIKLVVRGFCCLKAGVEGLSENIEVISVLGQFLEHSRVYYFANGEENFLDGNVFIGSADWMVRNLERRVECITPLESLRAKKVALKAIFSCFKKAKNIWAQQGDGTYRQKFTDQEVEHSSVHEYLKDKFMKKTEDYLEFENLYHQVTYKEEIAHEHV